MEGTSSSETQVGCCKWFNVLKGYGFITPDSGDEDVFVHQSEIRMQGFRSLEAGERVRFTLRKRKEGFEAVDVQSEAEGADLKGSSIRPLGKMKGNVVRCFNCGRYGNHVAAKCKISDGKPKKVCYRCRSEDHLFVDCPLKKAKPFAVDGAYEGVQPAKAEDSHAGELKQSFPVRNT